MDSLLWTINSSGMHGTTKFKVEDAVSLDASDYDLAPPGSTSKLPGIVVAVNEGPEPSYDVRVRLRLGSTLDLTVPAERVEAA